MAEVSGATPESLAAYARAWVDAWEQVSVEEKPWRDSAEAAGKAYAGDETSEATAFNIFHSNIETLVPSLYNSTPSPDVRRRFADDDHIGKEVGDLIERALSFSVDAYDYDDVMDRTVRDMAIRSRGLARIRYVPTIKGTGDKQRKVYEEVTCEHVSWASFRRGPAKVWSQVPWIGFEHFIDRKEVERLAGLKGGDVDLKQVSYTYSADAKTQEDAAQRETPRFGARARVLEIWDKDNLEVLWILPDNGAQVLARIPDPLELQGFFPVPRPMQCITQTDSLIPVTAYSIYRGLIEELGEVTRRIQKLVKQLRPRGGYAGVGSDVKLIADADDGELVPLTGAEMFASQGGKVDNAITWYPLEPIILALKQLVEHREQIKQTIYEVTGLSDILRGASEASETATAQQIKTQWGSVRIQKMQAEVQRFARDLFRMKAELMCSVFDMQTFGMITGLKYPSQADKEMAQQQLQMMQQQAAEQAAMAAQEPGPDGQPQEPQEAPEPEMPPEIADLLQKPSLEEIEELLRDDAVRQYRIDIESDSTIRGDLTKNQESMKGFLEGTGAFAQAVGPLVQQGAMPEAVAIEIYGAFARHFKLGKQAEDALDKWADGARKKSEQGNPAEAAQQAQMQKDMAEVQIKKQLADKDGEEKDRRFELDRIKTQHEMSLSAEQAEHAKTTADRDHALKERGQEHAEISSERDHGLQRDAHEHTRAAHQAEHGLKERGQAHTEQSSEREHGLKQRAQNHTEMAHGDGHGLEREKLADAKTARREDKGLKPVDGSEEAVPAAVAQSNEVIGQLAKALEGLTQSQASLAHVMAAPTKLVRGPDGAKTAVKQL